MSQDDQTQQPLGCRPDEGTNADDEAWLAPYPPELQQVARRYGQDCFQLVMRVGAMNEGIRICFAARPPKQVQQALLLISAMMNELGGLALKGAGIEMPVFLSCKQDIEALAEMAGPAGAPAASRIILPS